jgi:hypothetical protein
MKTGLPRRIQRSTASSILLEVGGKCCTYPYVVVDRKHDGFVASEKKNFEIMLLFLKSTAQCRTLGLGPILPLSSFRVLGELVSL